MSSLARTLTFTLIGSFVPMMSGCGSATAPPSLVRASTADSTGVAPKTAQFTFKTIDALGSLLPTEILGINNLNKLCGFYSDPNVGFVVRPPYKVNNFIKEVYPGAADTQITSINNTNTIAGWYETAKGQIYGLTEWEGIFTKYQDPHLLRDMPQYTKLLGLSDDDLAVGYYQDSQKIDHSFEVDLATGKFQGIDPPNAKSSAATGINGKGDIVGWVTLASGTTEGWLLKGGAFTTFAYPSAVETEPAALNWSDDIVGSYQDVSGNTHGFVLTNPLASQAWTEIDVPSASGGETVVTSVNNHHLMVGYYQDASGNINGFLASPNL